MKTRLRILLGTLLMVIVSSGLIANSGIFESYIILNANNAGNTFYDLQANTGNSDFQGSNFGSFSCENTLVLNGGQNKTFKNGSDDITGATLFYRVYLQGSAPGNFIPIGLNNVFDLGGGDQAWQTDNASVNLLDGLTSGTYVIEVYSTASFTFDGGSGTHFASNNGNNFLATFTVESPLENFTGSFCNTSPITLALDINGVANLELSDVYDGYFDGCPGIEVSLLSSAFDCENLGVFSVPVIATDDDGNTAICLVNVTILFEIGPNGEPISGCGCSPGEYVSIEFSGGLVDVASCEPCPPGTSCDGQLISICPPGTYSPGGVEECTLCPAGTFQPNQGAINENACVSCAEGTGSLPGSASCADCGPGFYQQLVNGETICTVCPPGRYCPDGEVSIPCAAGAYSAVEGAVACTLCEAGTSSSIVGATSCIACPVGTYQGTAGQTECLECLAGTANNLVGQVACASCPAGTFSATDGAEVCELCPQGQYQGASGQTSCLNCPAGTSNDQLGQVACAECPPGSFSDSEGQLACALCPSGTFQDAFGATACLDCPEGLFGNSPGAVACETCLPGYFQVTEGGITTCTICPPGTYCPDGEVSIPCAAGAYSAVEGAVSCTLCEAGTSSSITGAISCAACPSGTYQGTAGQTECLECLAGTANNLVGQVACASCPAGTFSATDGAEVCELCPQGQFQGASGQTSCLNCPAGTSNDQLGQVACAECPPGSFSGAVGQAECSLCPAGTFQDQSGATACQDCEEGSSSGQGSAFCTNCPADQVLPLNDDCVAVVPDLTEEEAVLLASPSDFSGIQGQVWEYGMYPFGGYASYTQLPNWTGFVWNNPGTNLDFPQMDANGGHPELDNTARMAVRRWVSTVTGTVRVFGDFFDRNTECGDGANVRIFKNGVQEYEYLNVPGSSVAYSQIMDVAVGDNIDFVIDRKFDGGCDDTHFANNVEHIISQSQSPLAGTLIAETTIVTVTTLVHGNATVCEVELTLEEEPGVLTAICNESVTVFLDENGNGALSPSDVNNGSTVVCGDLLLSLDRTDFTCTDITNGIVSSPISELFISEYVEGSSNNKCIEIYNGTGADVDLGDYALRIYSNGSNTPGPSILLVGAIQSGETHVVCNPSSAAGFLAAANQTSGSLTFNGDDDVALAKNGTNIDIIGQIGVDPGSEWGSGLTSTADNTIRRKPSVFQGDTEGSDVFDPALEWDGFATDSFNGLGAHAVDGPVAPEALLVELTVTNGNGLFAMCTSAVNVVDNIDPIAICQDVTVYLDENGVGTLTTEAVNNGSSDNCGVELTLDRTEFTCADLQFEEDLLATDLFISEYIEGSGNNKYIEIFNGTGAPVDLSDYALRLYANGASTAGSSFNLSGALANGEVVVFKNSAATIYPGVATVSNTVINFNGDDAIELFNNASNSPADIFGEIGVDPGSAWTSGSISTVNKTLRRKSTVLSGVTTQNSGFPTLTTEWDVFDQDDATGLGNHSILSGSEPTVVTLTATDGSGNTNTCAANVTVLDNVPPTAVCQNIQVALGADGTANISADDVNDGSSDNCGIASLSIDIDSFDCEDIGANIVVLAVTDLSGHTATCNATVTVVDNLGPELTCSPVVLQLGADGTAMIDPADFASATDNCGPVTLEASQSVFTCADLETPVVATDLFISEYVEGSSNNKYIEIFNGTGSEVDLNNYELRTYSNGSSTPNITSNLGLAGTLQNGAVAVFANSQANLYTGTEYSITAISFNGDDAVELYNTITESSVDIFGKTGEDPGTQWNQGGNSTLDRTLRRNSDVTSGNTDDAPGFPSLGTEWTAYPIDDISGLGTHSIGNQNTVVVTATDANGNVSSCEAIVTVEDNLVPDVICQNITIQLDANGNASISAAQVDNGSNDNCSIASMTLSPTSFDCSNIGPNTVTLTVTDGSGNASSCDATVTVQDNLAPAVVCQNITVQLDANGIGAITSDDVVASASDNCGNVSFTLSQSAFDCGDLGPNIVTVTANDGNGNTASCEATVTVEDNLAPAVVCQNITVQLDTDGIGSITADNVVASASDNCGNVTFALSQSAFGCGDLGPNIVTVTANDGNGNTASCEATVTVEDNIAPTILCNNLDIELDEDGFASVTPDDLDAGSSDNCALAFLEIENGQSEFGCDDIGQTFEIELTAGDGSGNTGSCTAEVMILPSLGEVDPCEEPETCPGVESIVNPEASCAVSGNFNGGWFNANQGTVYCFGGTYNGGHINISNGSTVRLSGTGTIGVTVGYNATLEILDGADIDFSSLSVNWGANGMVVYPGAVVNYDNTFGTNSDVINCGEFNVKRLQVNFSGSFTNNGLLHVYDQSFLTGINGDFVNNAQTVVDGDFALYYTGSIVNNCHIEVDGDLFVHRNLDNYSFVEVGGCSQVFYTGRVNQYDGAMIETGCTIIIGKYTGSGSPSLVKVLDETIALWTGRIEGALYYCDEDGLELVIGNNLFQNGAIDDCNIDILVSECNPRGHVGFAKSNALAGNGKGDEFDISEFAHLLEGADMSTGGLMTEIDMAVWPNPTRGNSVLSISETHGERLLLELYDTNGRLVQKLFEGETLANQPFTMVLDLNSLENGLYYIRAITGETASTLRLVNAK